MFTDRNTKSFDLKDCCTAEKKGKYFPEKRQGRCMHAESYQI